MYGRDIATATTKDNGGGLLQHCHCGHLLPAGVAGTDMGALSDRILENDNHDAAVIAEVVICGSDHATIGHRYFSSRKE